MNIYSLKVAHPATTGNIMFFDEEPKGDIMAELFGADHDEDEEEEEDGVTMQDLFGADVEDEDLMEEPSPMSALEAASAKPQKR